MFKCPSGRVKEGRYCVPKKENDIGDKINKAWREYLNRITAKDITHDIKQQFSGLSKKDEEDFMGEFPQMYAVFSKDKRGNVDVEEMTIDYASYWQGTSGDNVTAVIPIHRHTTKKELMEYDVAEETQYYERDDWK